MPSTRKGLRNSVALNAVLTTTRNLGFHSSRGLLKGRKSEIDQELSSRLMFLIKDLFWYGDEDLEQLFIFKPGEVERSRHNPDSYLARLLKTRFPPRVRGESVRVTTLQDITMMWSASLVVRGFRGVSNTEFLNRLRKEVEWLLKELGYQMLEDRSYRCPFFGSWHEHEHWRSLCRADGLKEEEISFILDYRKREKLDGCPGYSGESAQIHLHLETA